jgi:beta-lactamase class D
MKRLILSWLISGIGAISGEAGMTQDLLKNAFRGTEGSFVLRDCSNGHEIVHNAPLADTSHGPCSTFKIWNSLIGIEERIIHGPDDAFWNWDGVHREFRAWNRDQTWRSAFTESCVPAFQDLARRIGEKRMQSWLDKLDFGNRDMAGRPDAFWLPRAGGKTIMITPRQQARMVCALLNGRMPVGKESVAKLSEVMRLRETRRGVWYGKTGSGLRSGKNGPESATDFDMGWLVGFIECGERRHAYACLVLGPGRDGANARKITEALFSAAGML